MEKKETYRALIQATNNRQTLKLLLLLMLNDNDLANEDYRELANELRAKAVDIAKERSV